LKVDNEQLEIRNTRRNGVNWSHYFEQEAAMEVYGSTRKKI